MPLSDANILLIEDNLLFASELEMAIEDAGGTVVGPAPSLVTAFELVQDNRVHAAVVDVNLADGDSTAMIGLLLRHQVPFVVVTGVGLPQEWRSHPGIRVLHKPQPVRKIVRELAALLPAPTSGVPLAGLDRGGVGA